MGKILLAVLFFQSDCLSMNAFCANNMYDFSSDLGVELEKLVDLLFQDSICVQLQFVSFLFFIGSFRADAIFQSSFQFIELVMFKLIFLFRYQGNIVFLQAISFLSFSLLLVQQFDLFESGEIQLLDKMALMLIIAHFLLCLNRY